MKAQFDLKLYGAFKYLTEFEYDMQSEYYYDTIMDSANWKIINDGIDQQVYETVIPADYSLLKKLNEFAKHYSRNIHVASEYDCTGEVCGKYFAVVGQLYMEGEDDTQELPNGYRIRYTIKYDY